MGAFLSSRYSLYECAAFCRRMATSLTAGLDIRRVFAREAQQARSPSARRHFDGVSAAIAQGESLSAALDSTGDFLPPLLREMIAVGEQTGQQGEIFAQMAEHYENQLQLRRSFVSTITWPVIELTIAIGVVGFLIWFGGVTDPTNKRGLLGIGLVGNSGLMIYLGLVMAAAALLFFAIRAASRGLIWVRPLQLAILRMPVLGSALQTLSLARLAWSMHLTMNAGMEVRRALRLSLKSTRNAQLVDRGDAIDAAIGRGESIHEAFAAAGGFPADFLDTVYVGEESGKLVESMANLSRQYQDQARAALSILTRLAGIAVWMVVAAIILVLIFRLFSSYISVINSFLQ